MGPDFIIVYRLSMLDLVDEGSTWEEIVLLAKEIESAGASIINTGIGWHEAQIPTIATMVPRGAFSRVTKRMKGEVSIPLCTTNRINTPEVGEFILQEGSADMISMARPLLADSHFVNKALEGKSDEINTCIGCNQACLDHIFEYKRCSCLVNPVACHEDNLEILPISTQPLKVAVIGSGPGGLACATTCAERGHKVVLFEKEGEIGGQFNLAKRIPGKEEFYETIRYFRKKIENTGVDLRTNTMVDVEMLREGGFDAVVFATGVNPRSVPLSDLGDERVVMYNEVLNGSVVAGRGLLS